MPFGCQDKTLARRTVGIRRNGSGFRGQLGRTIEPRDVLGPSALRGRLLDGGRSVVAGRLAGAFRRIGRGDMADESLGVMKRAGYDARETDPFESERSLGALSRAQVPIVGRLQLLWETMREPVIAAFPEAPGLPDDPEAHLSFVDEIYRNDAYHSLSIEGYRVTPDLIERVRAGNWDSDNLDIDRQCRDALARAATGRRSDMYERRSVRSSAAVKLVFWFTRPTATGIARCFSLASPSA